MMIEEKFMINSLPWYLPVFHFPPSTKKKTKNKKKKEKNDRGKCLVLPHSGYGPEVTFAISVVQHYFAVKRFIINSY